MLVEPHTEGMHQKRAKCDDAEPQIACLHPFERAPIGQLPKHRVNPRANLPLHRTPGSRRVRQVRIAERRWQDHPILAQFGLQVRQAGVAISQHQRSRFPIGFIGGSQEHMGDDARPARPQMPAKTVQGLAIGLIVARTGLSAKAPTPGRTGKAADRKRHAVNDPHLFRGGSVHHAPASTRALWLPTDWRIVAQRSSDAPGKDLGRNGWSVLGRRHKTLHLRWSMLCPQRSV